MVDDILRLSAYELAGKYAKKEISPVDVYKITQDAIFKRNEALNAFTVIDSGMHLKYAEDSEKRWFAGKALGVFDGVPVTLKDCFDVKGWPTHLGSNTRDATATVTNNSLCTNIMRSVGAVIVGKTTMPDLFWKITNESPKTGITRNPWDLNKTPGGSSGGAASATAAGLGYVGLSSDAAGSIRVPASFCGLVGIKPSNGVVPYTPQNKAGDFAVFGPIGRSVSDVAFMVNCLQYRTPKDPWTLRTPTQDFLSHINGGIKEFKIAHTNQLSLPYGPEYEVVKTVEDSLAAFMASGAIVDKNVEILSDTRFKSLSNTFEILRLTSLYSIIQDLPVEKQKFLDAELYQCSMLGKKYNVHELLSAELDKRLISVELCEFFEKYDALILPTIHRTAFPVSAPAYPLNDISLPPLSVSLFNMTGFPAVTVPCGLSKDGMPIGMQIVSAPNQDAKLLRIARNFEKMYSFPYFRFYDDKEGV